MLPPNEFRSPVPTPALTAREMQVLASLMLGKTNREIGRELFVAEGTVKTNVGSIFRKLGVSTRTEAAVVGWETFPMLRVLPSKSSQTIQGTEPGEKGRVPNAGQAASRMNAPRTGELTGSHRKGVHGADR